MADELRQSKADLQRKSQERLAEVILPCVASGAGSQPSHSVHRARLEHTRFSQTAWSRCKYFAPAIDIQMLLERKILEQAERALDLYREQLQDKFSQKLEAVQRSIADIQATAEQKNDVLTTMEDQKSTLEMELAASKARMPELEHKITKLEESNFDFKDR